jgi:hypothetical protein
MYIVRILAGLIVLTIPFLPQRVSADADKLVIGQVEDVVLLPWDIRFHARIDTGAAISSLDATDLKVRNNVAYFKLGKRYGDLPMDLPIVGWQDIRTSEGSEKRPVVRLGICVGSKYINTLVTLNDRSKMVYPFLVGRSALSGNFVVDASQSNVAPPTCPQVVADTASFPR